MLHVRCYRYARRIHRYSNLVSYLADDETTGAVPPSDPAPPDLDFPGDSDVISRVRASGVRFFFCSADASRCVIQSHVVFDSPGTGKKFGDLLVDVPAGLTFTVGQTVSVQFVEAKSSGMTRLRQHRVHLLADTDCNCRVT